MLILTFGCAWSLSTRSLWTLCLVNLIASASFCLLTKRRFVLPPFMVKADAQSCEAKEQSALIPEAAIPDITAAAKSAFQSGRFVWLTPDRYNLVRKNWKLCLAGKGWSSHKHRPWQNRDMMNNFLRETKTNLRKTEIQLWRSPTLTTFRKWFA